MRINAASLRRERERRGLGRHALCALTQKYAGSQERWGRPAGAVSYSYLCKIETGDRTEVSPEVMSALSKALHVTSDVLGSKPRPLVAPGTNAEPSREPENANRGAGADGSVSDGDAGLTSDGADSQDVGRSEPEPAPTPPHVSPHEAHVRSTLLSRGPR